MAEKSTAKRVIVPLLLALVIGWLTIEAFRPTPMPQMAFTDIEGQHWSSTTWRSAPWYVALWSVDCSTCIGDFPKLIQLQQRLKSQGGQVIAVAIAQDPIDRVKTLSSPLQSAGIIVVHDADEHIAKTLDHKGVTPYGLLVDPDGDIDRITVGSLNLTELLSRLPHKQ